MIFHFKMHFFLQQGLTFSAVFCDVSVLSVEYVVQVYHLKLAVKHNTKQVVHRSIIFGLNRKSIRRTHYSAKCLV